MAINQKMIFYAVGILLIALGLLTKIRGIGFLEALGEGFGIIWYTFYLFGFVYIRTTNILLYLLGIIIPILVGIILLIIPKVKKW